MKCSRNSTIIQNLNCKTFYLIRDPNGKIILFLFLKNNIHLIVTLCKLLTFYFIKPINFIAEIQVLQILKQQSLGFVTFNENIPMRNENKRDRKQQKLKLKFFKSGSGK